MIGGRIHTPENSRISSKRKISCLSLISNENLDNQLKQFWTLEECHSSRKIIRSREEEECEEHFLKTVRRDNNGRFLVSIPLKGEISQLGNSRESAKRRLFALERRLNKNESLREQYCQFMAEYESLGHMSLILEENYNANNSYYLPHHAVINTASSTTKLRVVFDGSAITTSGKSINHLQKVGPVIQDRVFSILTRFRTFPIVITSDIAKMYRQVLINPAQRDLQRILWRTHESDPIQEFTLNTVTYGTASASY